MSTADFQHQLDTDEELSIRGEMTERLVKQRCAAASPDHLDLLTLDARFTCRSLPSRVLTWLGNSGIAFKGDGQTLLMLRVTLARLQVFAEFTVGGELFAEAKSLTRLDQLSVGLRLLPLVPRTQPAIVEH